MKTTIVTLLCLLFVITGYSQNFDINKPLTELEKDYIKYYETEFDAEPIVANFIQLLKAGKAKDYEFPNLAEKLRFSILKSDDERLKIYSFYTGGSMSASEDIIVYTDNNRVIIKPPLNNDEGASSIVYKIFKLNEQSAPLYVTLSKGSISSGSGWIEIGTFKIEGENILSNKIPFSVRNKIYYTYSFDASHRKAGAIEQENYDNIFNFDTKNNSFYLPGIKQIKGDFPQWNGDIIKVKYQNSKFIEYSYENPRNVSASNPSLILDDLKKYSSHEQLTEKYGVQNVSKKNGMSESGDVYYTILYPNTENEAIIYWNDNSFSGFLGASVNITDFLLENIGKKCNWKTASGLKLGMSIDEVVKLNGKPVIFSNFEIDNGGSVTSYNYGELGETKSEH